MARQINDRMVETFKTVITVGTTTAAAEVLNTSQSSISRSLRRLEEITKVRLFDRIKGRLIPTNEGNILFDEVQRSYVGLDKIENTARALRLEKTGHIGFLCAPVMSYRFIARAVERFTQKHPGVSVTIETQLSPIIAELMSAQKFDLAIADLDYVPPGVRSETFFAANDVCLIPKEHKLAQKKSITLKDFHNETLICYPSDTERQITMDRKLNELEVTPQARVVASMSETVGWLVAKNVGVAVLAPVTAVSFFKTRDIVVRPLDYESNFETQLWRPRHKASSMLVDPFIESLKAIRAEYQKDLEQKLNKS